MSNTEKDIFIDINRPLQFDQEESRALYHICAGLSTSFYENTQVEDKEKPAMAKVYEKVIAWGRSNIKPEDR